MKNDWLKDGMEHIWLPYAQMKTAPLPLPVASTMGSTITLADGRTLIDGIASWWSACHGYNHPHIISSMQAQLKTMPHVMFGGLVHEQALKLAKRLCAIAPGNMQRVFFSDSGSVAVEVALKMVQQYWRNKGQTKRDKFISFRNAYHGDTPGAMSVSEPEDLHKAFRGLTIKNFQLEIPNDEYSLADFTRMMEGLNKTVAGLIIEPLVQCAGGMKFHSPDVLAEIYRVCKQYDVPFIIDEIATGFGRTGMMFACQEAGIAPDIVCMGKALTGGSISLAATLATQEIFEAFLNDDPEYAFMHGPTYMANPLACAAANASLDLFEQEPRLTQVEKIERAMHDALEQVSGLSHVVDVRIKGGIGVIQLDTNAIDKTWFRDRFVKKGLWLRPMKDVVYACPALNISDKELSALLTGMVDVVREWDKGQ